MRPCHTMPLRFVPVASPSSFLRLRSIGFAVAAGCLLLILPANAQDEFPDASFFVGSYRLIGKVLECEEAFLGRVVLRIDGEALVAERTVGDSILMGTWALEYALGEEMRVVRMRFGEGENRLEGTYQWSVDFDNYPRLSGYVYRPQVRTDDPGMEVLFILPPP
ncbi:MAG: hypothetical protein JXA28_00695 [Bacteroidetes bacterium]|nr:hypothetical protein [Bacteroidota bacterium]